MTRIVVPVRYPLTAHSKRTLEEAIRVAEERDASLTVLHVNLYQRGRDVSRVELKRAVESAFGRTPRTRYAVREGFLIEETILEEIAADEADVVVIGHKQAGRWRRMLRKLTANPDIEETILEEVAADAADVVVIGHKQAGRWRRMLRKLTANPDIESYLRGKLDAEVITVGKSAGQSSSGESDG